MPKILVPFVNAELKLRCVLRCLNRKYDGSGQAKNGPSHVTTRRHGGGIMEGESYPGP